MMLRRVAFAFISWPNHVLSVWGAHAAPMPPTQVYATLLSAAQECVGLGHSISKAGVARIEKRCHC